MTDTALKETRIRNCSQELLVEVVNTFPVAPVYFDVQVMSGGVPSSMCFEDKARFIRECLEKSVIPFSEVTYEFEESLFLPYEFRVWKSDLEFDERQLQEAIALFQPHKKIFKAKPLGADRAFDVFRNLLPSFVSRGDKLGVGEITTSIYHLTGYNQGDYFDTGLRFGDENLGVTVCNGLKLEVENIGRLSQDHRDKLVSWFEVLKDKYDRKQARIF